MSGDLEPCPFCGALETEGSDKIENDGCRVCGAPIETAELCDRCAEGNDPFPEIKSHAADLRR